MRSNIIKPIQLFLLPASNLNNPVTISVTPSRQEVAEARKSAHGRDEKAFNSFLRGIVLQEARRRYAADGATELRLSPFPEQTAWEAAELVSA